MIIVVYVDDVMMTGSMIGEIERVKNVIGYSFEIRMERGRPKFFEFTNPRCSQWNSTTLRRFCPKIGWEGWKGIAHLGSHTTCRRCLERNELQF